jgi:hypothetical protein
LLDAAFFTAVACFWAGVFWAGVFWAGAFWAGVFWAGAFLAAAAAFFAGAAAFFAGAAAFLAVPLSAAGDGWAVLREMTFFAAAAAEPASVFAVLRTMVVSPPDVRLCVA